MLTGFRFLWGYYTLLFYANGTLGTAEPSSQDARSLAQSCYAACHPQLQ